MTTQQIVNFCAPHAAYSGTLSFLEKPFRVGDKTIASNGYMLLALSDSDNSLQIPKLNDATNYWRIMEWINFPVPETKYSCDHLKGFLGEGVEGYASEPMMFAGERVDRRYIRKVFLEVDEPYRYCIASGKDFGVRFHFVFEKFTALIMGMREPNADDPRYTPKVIK
jgi:hypothetical protein